MIGKIKRYKRINETAGDVYSVLEVSVRANKEIVNQLKGEGDSMCQALLEIMEPEINEIRENDKITQLINTSRKYGATDEEILEDIISEFHCSVEKAKGKLKEYDKGKGNV